jgi:hypothetical protein
MHFIAYFILQLRFWLPEMGNHQKHALVVFYRNAHKVMKDSIYYAHIPMNNQYYKEALHQNMSKKRGSSPIYLTRSNAAR